MMLVIETAGGKFAGPPAKSAGTIGDSGTSAAGVPEPIGKQSSGLTVKL